MTASLNAFSKIDAVNRFQAALKAALSTPPQALKNIPKKRPHLPEPSASSHASSSTEGSEGR
jgi:hypothetical protein